MSTANSVETELFEVCRTLAKSALTNQEEAHLIEPDEIFSNEDWDKLATAYYKFAETNLTVLRQTGGDPRMIARAVRYMTRDAMPMVARRAEWFRYTLDALLSVAYPVGNVEEDEPFFADMRRGMKQAERGEVEE